MDVGSSVLVVEDNGVIACDMEAILTQAGYRVVGVAASADAAMVLAESSPPAVAVVDIKLATDIDGVTLAEELTNHFGTKMIFVTADPKRLVDRGSHLLTNFLGKPFRPQDLLGALERI